jgi:hypothetical protein
VGSPFLRPDEQRDEHTPGQTPGVLVDCPGAGRWFFPGGSPELALILAREALGETRLAAPGTRLEFGTRRGKVWVGERVLKVAVGVTSPPRADEGWG